MKKTIYWKREKHNIRTRILITFSALLFLSFLSVSIAFNLAVRQYIYTSAAAQLDEAVKGTVIIEIKDDTVPPKNIFKIQSNMFNITESYEFLFPVIQDDDFETKQEIAQKLEAEKADLSRLKNREIVTVRGNYYVTASPISDKNGQLKEYRIFYADVTGLTRFADTVNMLMFMLVSIIWFITAVITTVLSGSIARPIRTLSDFALRLGQGNFTTYNYFFREKELDNLNRSLNQAAKQLEIYDSDQKTFFQNASHELRTPLMSIKCYAEGIVYGVMEPEKAGQIILEETDRLTEMVDDLLYISKIDNISPVSRTDNVDLRAILRSCADNQKAIAEKNGIAIKFETYDEPVMYLCVEKLIMRAVSNLISNALRYAASEITLSCAKKKDKIEITIRDDGKGIEPEVLPRIFERFLKGTDGSHGIGLSMVKSIAAQHGGTVTAQNTGKGAMFTITLPS